MRTVLHNSACIPTKRRCSTHLVLQLAVMQHFMWTSAGERVHRNGPNPPRAGFAKLPLHFPSLILFRVSASVNAQFSVHFYKPELQKKIEPCNYLRGGFAKFLLHKFHPCVHSVLFSHSLFSSLPSVTRLLGFNAVSHRCITTFSSSPHLTKLHNA